MGSPHAHRTGSGTHPLLLKDADPSLDAAVTADLGIWRWDAETGKIELSKRLLSIIGFDTSRFTGTLDDLIAIVHPKDRDRIQTEMRLAAIERRGFSWQARIIRPDGAERTVLAQGRPTDLMGGTEIVGICADISSRRRAASAIGRLERRLTHIIAESPAMISIKDLDHRYRLVNHNTALLAGLPMEQLIGHTATEVFPVVGPAIDAQAADAVATMETMHSDVEMDVSGETRIFHLISFALSDHSGAPVEVCCMATDVTDARRQQEQARLRRESTELIGSALREDRLVAVSQPVVDISLGHTASEELLVRLALPGSADLLQPRAFLPVAERFGLVQEIDLWMLDRALAVAAQRPAQVNLSAVTLTDPAACEAMLAALRRSPEAATRIVFEITETAAADHLDAAARFARALTDFGCGLALDDFGTGFGSFTYLRRLPLRHLKIDRSFVSALADSEQDRKVVASIIGIAKQFGLSTIAEGVEDIRTFEILGDLGADFGQGFYLGHPAPLKPARPPAKV
jgi:PAS domain S-box-containing protein